VRGSDKVRAADPNGGSHLKAEDLVALVAAHGVDLQHVAGSASDTHGIARRRQRTKDERRGGLPIRDTVIGHESRVYRRPAWSHAELGMAARDVPRMPWLAICYCYAGDSTGYPELHRGLMREALKIATRDGWSMYERDRTGQKRYAPIAELAALVLDKDAHKRIFIEARAHGVVLEALCLNVPDEIWSTRYERRFDTLDQHRERWLAEARGIIQRWLREPDHNPPTLTVAA